MKKAILMMIFGSPEEITFFSRPFIPDVIKQMEVDGVEECICLILEPHYSFYPVIGCEKFLES